MKCSICKDEFKDDRLSHNAEPVNNGRCCGICNHKYVVPERMRILFESECG